MTNRIAFVLAALILGFVVADHLAGWGFALFLAREFVVLVDWIAFWR